MLCGRTHGELVAEGTQTQDAAHRNVGEIGLLTKWLPRMRVGQMNLDERYTHGEQRVPKRDARMRKGTRIDEQKLHSFASRLVNAINERVLRVALKCHQLVAGLIGYRGRALLDGGECVRAVERRLTAPQ